ncbi:hypothetical protein [Oceaniferula flava]|uniref:hypothetical protein n=1 Tax=Oceaniferula flava TaxID=2800421 RepID=UPI002867D887|nr:hypothetical protein [Oceaniferula flavus]
MAEEGFMVEQRSFRGRPITIAQQTVGHSYGQTYELYIYFGFEQDLKELGKHAIWRRCFQFIAGTYIDLRLEFDEDNDTLQIFGTSDKQEGEVLLLRRLRFSDSFGGHIPNRAYGMKEAEQSGADDR